MIKVKNSLLFVTQTLSNLKLNLKYLLEESFKLTNDNLFIYINPIVATNNNNNLQLNKLLHNERYQLKLILNQFYQNSFQLNPNVNVTCLLSNIHNYQIKSRHQLEYDLVLTDLLKSDYSMLNQFLNENIINSNQNKIEYLHINCDLNVNNESNFVEQTPSDNDELFRNNTYENSIMGGTFDRLHNGHKIMLSEAVLLTRNQLLIGTTSETMLKRKKLAELIQSFELRCESVHKFLNHVNPNLKVLTPKLEDPFGPSIIEPDYQCLVVSRETFKTGEMVNTKRLENSLSELKIHVVELMQDSSVGTSANDGDEEKISSSNTRRRLLGTLLQPPFKPYDPSKPYVIGYVNFFFLFLKKIFLI